MQTPFVYNDGGREAAGFKGKAGDCVTRAVSIATGRPYAEVYAVLSEGSREQRKTRRSKIKDSARSVVNTKRKWFKDYMSGSGWVWVPTMQIGQGCKVHLRPDELPGGRIIVALSKHYAAVIDGVVHDTFEDARDGTRCVYGYWRAAA